MRSVFSLVVASVYILCSQESYFAASQDVGKFTLICMVEDFWTYDASSLISEYLLHSVFLSQQLVDHTDNTAFLVLIALFV